MDDIVIPAILIGGSGTRLWPISRSNKPKQFLALGGEFSMFQNTVARVRAEGFARPWLLANDDALLHVNAQLPLTGVVPDGVIVEPAQRGTAAAIAAVAKVIGQKNPNSLVLVMPADHVISKPEVFREQVLRAVPLAKGGKIVTFGIVPTSAETGFGYIRPGRALSIGSKSVGFTVDQPGGFLEKPDAVMAAKFVEQGYLWNAGIFLFKASTMLEEFKTFASDTFSAVSAAVSVREQVDKEGTTYHYLSSRHFEEAPKDRPIDTAIMEKSSKVAVLPCGTIGWHDVGSLSAIWEMADKCSNNNAVIGSGFAHESEGLLIYSGGGRKIVGSHIQDLMIVDTNDALIVIPRHRAQEIKSIVDFLKSRQEPEFADTRTMTMSWGEIQQVSRDDKVLVARVAFNSGSSFYRAVMSHVAETWTVASGEIELVGPTQTIALREGESISFDNSKSVALKTSGTPAICIVVCKLPSPAFSLLDIFANDIEPPHITLKVA